MIFIERRDAKAQSLYFSRRQEFTKSYSLCALVFSKYFLSVFASLRLIKKNAQTDIVVYRIG